jgi:hypothetical protein
MQMDAALARTLEIAAYYLAGYVLAILIGQVTIGPIVRQLIRRYLGPEREITQPGLARLIGALEQVLYISAILLGRPEFIGVWLLLKVAGEWRPGAREGQPVAVGQAREYTIFLFGNGLAVVLAVAMASLMQQLLPPFPSLAPWRFPVW